MKQAAMILATLVGFAIGAAAQAPERLNLSQSGNDFVRICDDTQAGGGLSPDGCTGYVHGVIDGMKFVWGMLNLGKPAQDRLVCIDENVTYGQEKHIAIQYIKTHPATAHYPTNALIFSAIIDAFPCPTQSDSKAGPESRK